MIHLAAKSIELLLDGAPFDPVRLRESVRYVRLPDLRSSLGSMVSLMKTGSSVVSDIPTFWEVLTGPASKLLNRWFESEPLKATLASDSVIGAMVSPYSPGSRLVLCCFQCHYVVCVCVCVCDIPSSVATVEATILTIYHEMVESRTTGICSVCAPAPCFPSTCVFLPHVFHPAPPSLFHSAMCLFHPPVCSSIIFSIHLCAPPSCFPSSYVLLHHVMGELDGKLNSWAYVEGGMGAVSEAIANYARSVGVQIHTELVCL